MQWYFLKEQKTYIMLLKAKYFYYYQQKQISKTNKTIKNTKEIIINIFQQYHKK